MQQRQLEIIYDENRPHFFANAPLLASKSAVILSPENFSKAKNLLGQEFEQILFDARESLNLDALAIAAGTIKAGGKLLLWLTQNARIDLDSQRWSGVAQGIFTPNFDHHLWQCIEKHSQKTTALSPYSAISSLELQANFKSQTTPDPQAKLEPRATRQQQAIINQILAQQADIFIVTAKRGRGKSALAGMLINQLLAKQVQQHSTPQTQQPSIQQVYVTAPNKSAVKTLQDFAKVELNFIAPDELVAQIQQQPQYFAEDWLFIDEAAQLSLPMLNELISTFKHIVITTTIHSYEGTGRGFLLKFLTNLHRTYQHFELTQPLRWGGNDPLEAFIDELLLLEAEDNLPQPEFEAQSAVKFRQVFQPEVAKRIVHFYGLLTLAHYRTSPLDLRRLFDAPKQQFYVAEKESALLGCAWLIEEGGLQDLHLIEQICRGERRPKGNLVAQSLAFHFHSPEACQLTSLRISRIAVQPKWQQNGIGQRLIGKVAENAAVDFLSVSFGYTQELQAFWQKCGFILVQMSGHKEATSGCYSAIAVRAISAQGKALVEKLQKHFLRDVALSFHPLAAQFAQGEIDWQLNDRDWLSLKNFAHFHRTLAAALPAICRLLAMAEPQDCSLLRDYCLNSSSDKALQGSKKNWLAQCRLEVKNWLRKYEAQHRA